MTSSRAGKPLRLTRNLRASPAEVFDAWTDPEQVGEWLCPGGGTVSEARIDLRVGGRFRVVMRMGDRNYVHLGEYREVRRPVRLVFTWISEETEGRETLVTVELRGNERCTEMTLTHEGLPHRRAEDRHRDGWTSIFERLEDHLG